MLEENWPGIMQTFSNMPISDESERAIAINTRDQFMLIIVPRGRIEFLVDGILFKKWANVNDNIMNKKKSHIEMQSRQEVAANNRAAEVSEIEAKREVALTHQQAQQQVGLRTVEAKQEVEIAEEKKKQLISSQAKETREKDLAITYLEQTKMAEIEREAAVTRADQEAKVMVRQAEAELETKTKEAQAIRLKGEAVADVKVITNSGTPENGLKDIMDLFSSHGGASMGAMLEGFVNTSPGKKIIEKLTGTH